MVADVLNLPEVKTKFKEYDEKLRALQEKNFELGQENVRLRNDLANVIMQVVELPESDVAQENTYLKRRVLDLEKRLARQK